MRPVRLQFTVSTFVCRQLACRCCFFTERVPELVAASARKTQRLIVGCRLSVWLLAGRQAPGSRITWACPPVGTGSYAQYTVCPLPVVPPLRAMGGDAWAPRKRQRYRTIVVDVERRRPVVLRRFATGLCADDDAVKAGMTLPWSTGPVEGHINGLKMLKRSMFGCAKIDLLSRWFLRAASCLPWHRFQGPAVAISDAGRRGLLSSKSLAIDAVLEGREAEARVLELEGQTLERQAPAPHEASQVSVRLQPPLLCLKSPTAQESLNVRSLPNFEAYARISGPSDKIKY